MAEFFNPFHHGYVRVAVCIPAVRVADPAFNASETTRLLRDAHARHALVAVFPELGLSAYSCDDLFHQQALLDASLAALADVTEATRDVGTIAVVGLPLQVGDALFNCAAVLHAGRVLGVVPKSFLPNYREFYEARQFAPAAVAWQRTVVLPRGLGEVPFGTDLLFQVEGQPLATFHVEICEDLWVPLPPSTLAALAGATVLLNLSASNVTIAKADYRRQLVQDQSARCLAAYAYSAAGPGESTTDLAWDGHGLVCENGALLAQSERFAAEPQVITADIDLERLAQERMRQTSFGQTARQYRDAIDRFRRIPVAAKLPDGVVPLERTYERFPYVPADPARRDERCREVVAIQVQGLATRMRASGVRKLVIGVSGGLDSAHAVLICAEAVASLGQPASDVIACVMPGFGSSERTQRQARQLAQALGCATFEIDIRPACMQMLKDIGHPYARGEQVYDVTFENVQAGERTSHLFRMANMHGALVVGTGDLSELALGWCTYGVGDQMSHYGVNASIPKTLVRHLIRWRAERPGTPGALASVLHDVLATRVSPELVPGDTADEPAQDSEAAVGPYELQDFHLYYLLRFGYRPSKVAYLAWNAWGPHAPRAPAAAPGTEHGSYSLAQIRHWLGVFLRRFIQDMQYKRTCMPNGPKVGSGGSLSPRGDWRAPSDARADAWLADLATVPQDEPPPAA